MMKLSLMRDVFKTVNSDWDCELATKLVENWKHDENWVKMWRASANFICYFRNNGCNYVTRFNCDSERSLENVESEIDLLLYLKSKNIQIAKPILSNNSRFIEKTQTQLGTFYSSVFERIFGDQHDIDDLKSENFIVWGKSLGQLHKVFKEIPNEVEINRISHEVLFEEKVKENPPIDSIELKEIENIRKWFKTLKKNKNNYGLIHYDFELDNVIWNDEGLYTIDFDDSIYSWYVADIAYALRDLFNDGKELKIDDERFLLFIEGYRKENDISKEELKQMSDFYRLHHFISYKKLQRAIDLCISDSNPGWMNDLIEKLKKIKNSYYKGFTN